MVSLYSLRPESERFIRVKLLEFWYCHDDADRLSVEMILSDRHGVHIHGSIWNPNIRVNERFMVIGKWIQIWNFQCLPNRAYAELSIVTTPKHDYMIRIGSSTVVSEWRALSSSLFYNFVHFEKIISKTVDPFSCFDLIGMVVSVSQIRRVNLITHDFPLDEMVFEFQNVEGMHIRCMIYGGRAHYLSRIWGSLGGLPMICIFIWWKVVDSGDVLVAQPAGGFSTISINKESAEVDSFRSMMPDVNPRSSPGSR